ncbi:MAG TPA: endopeptidase La, partial [Nitrospirae bacterium]|nr:endopeptidase La [Nitrospirota bacterium]
SVSFTSDAINRIIRNYTREAGVRNLEREIARICRKVARKIAEKEEGKAKAKRSLRPKTVINEKTLEQYLGEIKFRDELKEEKSGAGVATGLAWTEVGGVILKIETIILPGKTKFILTGKLGDVMKESAQAALSYIRSRARDFGLAKDFHNKIDIHVHIPEGATPKDGPSAGIALAASIVSALLGVAVRHDLAMTGEITLRGNILTVGGLKEKLLAAQRAGIKTVVIPKENKRDLKEVSENIKKDLEIIALEHMDEALKLALVKSPFKKVKSKSGSKRSRPQESGMSALN